MWKTVAGVVLVGFGVACIIATAGAASPIVAAVGVAVGTGTTIFESQILRKVPRIFIMEASEILTVPQ